MLLTLWQKAPREVYRVYGEDEYLSGQDALASEQAAQSPAGQEGPQPFHGEGSHNSRSGRLMGLGLLLGVIAGAIGLVVVNASHPHVPRSSSVARGGPASIATRLSVTTSSEQRRAVHRQALAGVHPGKGTPRYPARGRPPGAPFSQGRSHPGRAQRFVPIQAPEVIQPTGVEISASHGPPTSIYGEFDFER